MATNSESSFEAEKSDGDCVTTTKALHYPFCAQNPSWGFRTTLPLSKFQEKGFLEKDRLIIEVYIKIVEAVYGEGGGVSKKKRLWISSVPKIMLLRFEIDNFSEKKDLIASQVFVSGGCEWYLKLHPKGDRLVKLDDYLSLFLNVANPKSLRSGWKRLANYYFVLLNQSDKELYRSPIGGQPSYVFCAESPSWGWRYFLPLSKFQEKGFLENDRLIIEFYINIVEAFDGEGGDGSSEKEETMDINGFQVFASQVTPVTKIFVEHPDLAEDLKLKNQVVKTVYMNVLLNLIETLNKPSQNHSETELSNAHSELSELAEVGFKLDWLKLKLDEVSLKRKKADADGSWVQQLKNRVKNFELMESNFKLDPLKTKVEEVSLEMKKSDDADGSRIQQLEERLKNLELMEMDFKLDCLKSKLEEVSLDKKKADADWSRVQQLEESVKNLEIMVSYLIVELDKEKAKSSTDGFLLVDEVA